MIRLGKVVGVPIILSTNLLIFIAIFCGTSVFYTGAMSALWTLLGITSVAACVLLHEIGHVVAARHFGLKPVSITLNFYGGVASNNAYDWYWLMDQPKKAMAIWAAGPAVNVVLYGILTLAMLALAPFPAIVDSLAWVRLINVFMAVFNLLPLYPMDGGGIFYSILRLFMPKLKAIKIASVVSMIGCAVLMIFAIKFRAFIAAFIIISIFIEAKKAPQSPLFQRL